MRTLIQSIIERERISQAQMSAVFWLSAASSLLVALGLAACAPAIAWFFGDARLIALTYAFAFLVLLVGIQSQQFALLTRHLRFTTLAGMDILVATVSTTVGIVIAWLTSSYWALFAAGLASALLGLVCIWIVCSFRPGRPSFEGNSRRSSALAPLSRASILSIISRETRINC